MIPEAYEVPKPLLHSIIQYLATRPYHEVVDIFKGIDLVIMLAQEKERDKTSPNIPENETASGS